MATITFYEKPGCVNNTRQRSLLEAAGHRVIARNLLIEPWTCDRLRLFFADLPVPQWFNTTAPAITTGLVVPNGLDADIALELMVLDPLLIRRPLIEVGDQRWVGFDLAVMERWLRPPDTQPHPDLETCPQSARPVLLRRG
jgi:nitrogenase-associated protein